jgi:hypothetical protein
MKDLCHYWSNLFGLDCVCYDYVGYGLSKCANNIDIVYPTEDGCYRSIEIMMDVLNKKYDKIFLVGQSLGTGVCVDYCSKTDWIDPIILISPYKSLVRVMADSCLSSTIDSSFNILDKVPKLKCPVKIIHGKNDKLICVEHGVEILNKIIIYAISVFFIIAASIESINAKL